VAVRIGERIVVTRGGPANPNGRGVTAAADVIAAVIAAAGAATNMDALYVGAAGAGRTGIAVALRAALAAHLPRATIVVEDDARIALRAAIEDGPGAVVIAGTGSVAYAENGALRVRVGGDGFALGDEGSGYALGVAAVRALLRALDGRAPEGALARIARNAFGDTRDALLDAVYGDAGRVDVARVATLAPEVVQLADGGDAEADSVLDGAVRSLAALTEIAFARADLAPTAPVAFAGGLLRATHIGDLLAQVLCDRVPGRRIARVAGADDAAHAALRIAVAARGEAVRQ
jgi:N-acetylglucosamine kinase-like BadF-type ATPase